MNTTNPYIRLQLYYSWLIRSVATDDGFELGVSVRQLHEITDIPLPVIRKDFICMFQWQINIIKTLQDLNYDAPCWDTRLEFNDECEEFQTLDEEYGLSRFLDLLVDKALFPKGLGKLFAKGALDTLPIFIDAPGETSFYSLSLSREETAALQSFRPSESILTHTYENFNRKYQNQYQIKDSYLYTHQYVSLTERLNIIHQAINDGSCLQISYQTAKNNIIDFLCRPLKIAYDANENLYSIISIYEDKIKVHRLDHILSMKPSSQKLETPNLSLLDIAPNVWGNCFSEEPEHVKIKFYNEANVWSKVKKDLANRTNGKLYEEGGFLYYEDTVYGISKLRSWVYGYGSSAVVLEPASLRQQIIDSLKMRKEEGQFPN